MTGHSPEDFDEPLYDEGRVKVYRDDKRRYGTTEGAPQLDSIDIKERYFDNFYPAMIEKIQRKSKEKGDLWNDVKQIPYLYNELIKHAKDGKWLDVANFAMFLDTLNAQPLRSDDDKRICNDSQTIKNLHHVIEQFRADNVELINIMNLPTSESHVFIPKDEIFTFLASLPTLIETKITEYENYLNRYTPVPTLPEPAGVNVNGLAAEPTESIGIEIVGNGKAGEIDEIKKEIGFKINKMFSLESGVPEGFMGTLVAEKQRINKYRAILDALKRELGLHCCKGCGYGVDDDKIVSAVVKLKNDPKEQNHRVITVCGSTQYIEDIKKWAWERKKCGDIVFFTPFTKEDTDELEDYRLEMESQWFQMIRMADIVFIFNKDGHIGEHTKLELEYAKSIGKPIEYLELAGNDTDMPNTNSISKSREFGEDIVDDEE